VNLRPISNTLALRRGPPPSRPVRTLPARNTEARGLVCLPSPSTPSSQTDGSPGRLVRPHGPRAAEVPTRGSRVSLMTSGYQNRIKCGLADTLRPSQLSQTNIQSYSDVSLAPSASFVSFVGSVSVVWLYVWSSLINFPFIQVSGGFPHRFPRISDVFYSRIRARSSVIHLTESARADPDPGPRLRHRGFEHWPTSRRSRGGLMGSATLCVVSQGVQSVVLDSVRRNPCALCWLLPRRRT
jgi:hypothetical protein